MKKTMTKITVSMLTTVMTITASLPAAPVYAAAKKQSVYVISGIQSKDGNESYKFSYNKNGLVKKTVNGSLITTHKYIKKKISREIQLDHGKKTTLSYSYNGNGKIKKIVAKQPDGSTSTTSFTYKKGKLTKIKDGSTGSVWKFTYNGKGLRKKAEIKGADGTKSVIKYSYNSRNELAKLKAPWDMTETISYKYNKHGRKSIKVKYSYTNKTYNSTQEFRYKYKKITVSKSLVKTIRKQQNELKNSPSAYLFLF